MTAYGMGDRERAVIADARSRAWRTCVQGLLTDVAVAVIMVLATQVGDLQWTGAWWGALGLLLLKTAVQSGVAHLARRVVPPVT
jgi:hypothetical protein